MPDETTRLVVNLTSKGYSALLRSADREQLNRTTITNRAILMYDLVQQFAEAGINLHYTDAHGQTVRLVLL